MKYIRYFIYLVASSLIFGGGFLLLDFIFKSKILNGSISYKGIGMILLWGLLPVVGSIIKYKKKEPVNTIGMKNNYMKFESKYSFDSVIEWKMMMKDIKNYLTYDNQLFILEYEEENYLEYRTEEPINDIELKKRTRIKNIIIVEILKNENERIEIVVHKENSFSEFSNYDNEAVLRKIIDQIEEKRKLTIAST